MQPPRSLSSRVPQTLGKIEEQAGNYQEVITDT